MNAYFFASYLCLCVFMCVYVCMCVCMRVHVCASLSLKLIILTELAGQLSLGMLLFQACATILSVLLFYHGPWASECRSSCSQGRDSTH